MKRRIGTIYNKPIIEGDINLKTPNEIHKNELKGGGDNSNGGSVNKYAPRYFKIDWDKASSDWRHVLTVGNAEAPVQQSNIVFNIGATYKIIAKESNYNYSRITAYPFITINDTIGFSYIPLFVTKSIIDSYEIEATPGFQTFEDVVTLLSKLVPQLFGIEGVNLSMEGITEITEEEFYKID